MSIQYYGLDLNPRPSEREPPPLTTRPGIQPNFKPVYKPFGVTCDVYHRVKASKYNYEVVLYLSKPSKYLYFVVIDPFKNECKINLIRKLS